ncbi:BIRC6-like protein [Mya arenaria]|uniref:BIRC6-like protein n=1 Tax=Mya arenaria TaxID=6604 RepID=A0ABY7FUC7_MYAAR|nr:BIRC6-like protein [Mya arenaria]
MACSMSEDVATGVSREVDEWLLSNSDGILILLDVAGDDVDKCVVNLLLGSEYEVKLHVPSGYPNNEDCFLVESESVIQTWTIALNEFLLDKGNRLKIAEVLDRAVALFSVRTKNKHESSEDEDMEEEEEEETMDDTLDLDDDDTFTTAWELKVARKKMRWAKQEPIVREMMRKKRLEQGLDMRKQSSQQIFTSNAPSGILTNDLVKIMECEQECGFSAEPIEDNIYQWRVKLAQFEEGSDLAKDLAEIMRRHGYDYIEMEMMFEIDLFPFYPPLVKVLRPRLQGCMMQRITNIEFLQLSYWSPTKDMKSVIEGIRDFLQQWARIDVDHDRNDLSRCPYLYIEHHLLTLTQVSEMTPRANDKYRLGEDKITELKNTARSQQQKTSQEKEKDEFWAKGVGYGHVNRPGWDIDAYLAANREKDNKIESALRDIVKELKRLPACQTTTEIAATSSVYDVAGTSSMDITPPPGSGDFIHDIYTVLEGSVLIPFIEQHLKENSLLEISRHASVYTVIISLIREIAYRKELLPLLCWLDGQTHSLYQYLEQLNDKASIMLKQISKPSNGHLPESTGADNDIYTDTDSDMSDAEVQDCITANVKYMWQKHQDIAAYVRRTNRQPMKGPSADPDMEEKLAKEIGELFKLVKLCLEREDLIGRCSCPPINGDAAASGDAPNNHVQKYTAAESQYRETMKPLLFESSTIPVSGKHCHHYAKHLTSQATSKQQVIRIAQELSSLSSSLPLNLSSSIFVRTDDERISLMQALITGPEGTPYSNGCFVFDIFFPATYPIVAPKVNLRTTGNGTVRFNPNLYNCGMVCLSLLGTWQGQGGEQWNEKTSTVLQVLVSIQSLILVPDPYFNEPGYEASMKSDEGKKASDDYNKSIRIHCINHAMVSMLQHPPPGFESVIRNHFHLKKDSILQDDPRGLYGDVDLCDDRPHAHDHDLYPGEGDLRPLVGDGLRAGRSNSRFILRFSELAALMLQNTLHHIRTILIPFKDHVEWLQILVAVNRCACQSHVQGTEGSDIPE